MRNSQGNECETTKEYIWVDWEMGKAKAAMLAYNDTIKDARERNTMRHAILDQLELLGHRIKVHLGIQESVVLELGDSKVE